MSDTKLQIAKELTLALLEKDLIEFPPVLKKRPEENSKIAEAITDVYESIYNRLTELEKRDKN